MHWSVYIVLILYLFLFCLLLIPIQRSKRKRIVNIVKKYPNIRLSYRNKIAEMNREINGIFSKKGEVDYNEMYKLVEKMKMDRKYDKYKMQLDLILTSNKIPQGQLKDNQIDKSTLSLYVSIAGIVITILMTLVSIIFYK